MKPRVVLVLLTTAALFAAASVSAPAAGPPAAAPAPPAAAPGKGAPAAAGVAYVFPISGPIESHALVEALETGLAEARKMKAGLVILRMNTPGGRVDLADSIIKVIEKVDWAPVVSFVSGEDRRALSAGAYICLSTQKIFMAPGCTLGAATPFTRNIVTGAAQVDEKFTSAFRARFRSLAEMRGHSAVLADAMVDGTTSVVQIFVDGQPTLVTDDEARRLQDEHKSDSKFKRGKTLNKPGKLITLTSDEALEFKVCEAVVANEKELLGKMGMADYSVAEAKWAAFWIEKTTKTRTKKTEDLRASFRTHIEQAMAFDPQRSGFAPGSTQWRTYTDKAMAHLKECAKAITELENLAKDERYDLHFSDSSIQEMKTELDAVYRRLGAQRNL